MDFNKLPNHRKADFYREAYASWKRGAFDHIGFFPIFNSFKEEFILRELSGNALKLYVYLGLNSGNKTGETWTSIEKISQYFDKSPRAISNWIKELENLQLIERMQLKHNESAHTFLKPYGEKTLYEKKYSSDIKESE